MVTRSKGSFEDSDYAWSYGMKLTWDINDPKLPQEPKHFDSFQEWPDGYVRFIYCSEDKNAQRHLSGWAMRNTNNHNCQILKKSCLGVVACARNCTLPNGTKLQLRPAICDKARQKQQKKYCPNCSSGLELISCRGHSGYPVTNFWRHEGKVIYFQAKGIHDHPRPESKSETEARRSALKKQTLSSQASQKKKLLDFKVEKHHDNSNRFHYVQHIACEERPEQYSMVTDISLPFPPQTHHLFQNTEAYKVIYDASSIPGDVVSHLQKYPNCKTYSSAPNGGSECVLPNYLDSISYQTFHKDIMDVPMDADHVLLSGLQYCINSLNANEKNFDDIDKHHGFKQPIGDHNYGERIAYGLSQATTNHPHYSEEYTYKYGSYSSLDVPALQTVVTTTTKMSYEAYKPAAVKYGDNLYDAKDLLSCPLAETISGNVCPETKVQEEWGIVKSSLLGEQFLTPSKSEYIESVDTYQDGPNGAKNYTRYEGETCQFENDQY